MVYQQDTNYAAVLQIDPVMPCDVLFNLTAPDGSKRTAQGKGDRFGYFTSKEKWLLNQPVFGLTPLTPPGMVSKAGFQDFRIGVGTSMFWRTVVRAGQG
ncbi:MAG: hypothetical protein ABR985_12220 [Methanotrichaceae archaeon]|jgi:hypothetical protein